jgi:hypothetical protein
LPREPERTRCYRYSLTPSAVQLATVNQAAKVARRYWNALVAAQRGFRERLIRVSSQATEDYDDRIEEDRPRYHVTHDFLDSDLEHIRHHIRIEDPHPRFDWTYGRG